MHAYILTYDQEDQLKQVILVCRYICTYVPTPLTSKFTHKTNVDLRGIN